MKQASRAGWTRIEILLVAVVGMTAAGLVATFVVRSRAPAERVECSMHLQFLGAAVHAFHDDRKTLPASCIAPGYATWAVEIAPFLPRDQGKKLQPWESGGDYYGQPDAVRGAQVGLYYCPARRTPGQVSTSGDVPMTGPDKTANFPGALGDYACAPTSDNVAYPWTSPEADGALIVGEVLAKDGAKIVKWKARTTLDGLARGQSNTILLGEKHVPEGAFGQGQLGDGSLYNGDHSASFARLVGPAHGLAHGPTEPFNLNFGSWHPGVCQFLMADGSVRPFTNDASPKLLQDLVPRGLPR